MADWQKIARFVAARGIKVAGNLLKGLCYLFHAICPEKRFTIPSRAKPLIRHKRERVIPRVVWQTNFTRRVTLPIYLNYLFNRMMAPTFEFRLLDDVEIRRWVLSLYPGRTFDSFSKLQIGAAQADLWRLLILHAYGGVYLDIDAHFVWPLEWTIASRADELFLKHKLGLTNYFIASRSNTDSIRFALNAILHNIEYPTSNDVSEITGPAALDRALRGRDVSSVSYRVTCYQGTFTNEFFQYLDHRAMKWSREQRHTAVVAGKGTPSFSPIFPNSKPPL